MAHRSRAPRAPVCLDRALALADAEVPPDASLRLRVAPVELRDGGHRARDGHRISRAAGAVPRRVELVERLEPDAHGLREIGATLAIAVAAVGAGAGTAGAEGLQPALSTDHAVQATVQEAGMPRAMPSDYAQARAGEEQMPRAMPSDYAAADDAQAEPRGIENIRASQPPPAEAPDAMAGIEAVRVGGTAVPDPSTGIENVRAQRGPAEVGDGGATISAPSTGAAVAIAGGAMLTIAAAAFALRRRREPGLA